MIHEDLPFRVICVNSEDEVIGRADDLLVGRAAYETALRLFLRDLIQYRDGARIIDERRARGLRGGGLL
jgi:hypothetical protein